jgi:folate-binding protein YgfZ
MRTPLYSVQQELKASFGMFGDWELAGTYTDTADECHAVRTSAGLFDRSARAFLVVTGRDRFSWLQGMVSNDVRRLKDGEEVIRACLLNATGHMLADMAVVNRQDSLLLDLEWDNRNKVFDILNGFIIMEDVEIVDQSEFLACISVQGPDAAQVIEKVGNSGSTTICPADHSGEGGWNIFIRADEAPDLWLSLVENGTQPVGQLAANVLRIEAGIPKYGIDMDETNIPLECGLEATHISHNKGCYVGQEIIARIHSRGHTNRALTGFLVEGTDLPYAGERILNEVDGESRDIGWITSATYSPTLDRSIALGYLRHEYCEPGTRAPTEGGFKLTVSALPFVSGRA